MTIQTLNRMMLVCHVRSGKIIEATTAVVALVPLARWVRTLVSVLLDTIRCAFETTNTLRPSSQSEEILALLAIDKVERRLASLGRRLAKLRAALAALQKP